VGKERGGNRKEGKGEEKEREKWKEGKTLPPEQNLRYATRLNT